MMAKQSDSIVSNSDRAKSNCDVVENFKIVQNNIAEACIKAGRNPEEVTLLGVTKTVAPDRINAAIKAGLDHIGENRVQEFLSKRDEINLQNVRSHLIGHLQTNKVSKIVSKVDMIESIDSIKIAKAISEASAKAGIVTDVLIQVNIGREDTKYGVMEEGLEELILTAADFKGIKIRGLMTIPPIYDSEREKRAVFSRMYKLFIDISGKNIDNISMDILSMGMSSDYREAILEGSTIVRIGSAIFGRR
jgi:pyridoxal phosphate enzyme (YggS family)